MSSMKTNTSGGQRTGATTPGSTNSAAGKVPSTDGCPGLARDRQEVFGESPVPSRPTAENPTNTPRGRVADKDLEEHSNS
jgi:hypothetical protein